MERVSVDLIPKQTHFDFSFLFLQRDMKTIFSSLCDFFFLLFSRNKKMKEKCYYE